MGEGIGPLLRGCYGDLVSGQVPSAEQVLSLQKAIPSIFKFPLVSLSEQNVRHKLRGQPATHLFGAEC